MTRVPSNSNAPRVSLPLRLPFTLSPSPPLKRHKRALPSTTSILPLPMPMPMPSALSLSFLFFVTTLLASSFTQIRAHESQSESTKEFVLTLDHSNFSHTVSNHNFILLEFYAPWCGHCKKLAPEYERAASILSTHDPPVVLAKIDANEEENKGLATEFEIKGFPTLKILRNGGKIIQEYKGPRDADGIVDYLKKQSGPASAEINSVERASTLISDKKIVIVGIFPKFSGEEFENFTALAEKMRSDYEFGHTLDAKLLPRGETSVTGPSIRLFKPFDEQYVDFEDFDVNTLETFVEESSVPIVTVFDKDPTNHPFVIKFFNSANAKAMLFINFSDDVAESFKAKYLEAATQFRGEGISFLIGDIESSQGAFQYFGLRDDQVPLIIVQTNDGQKYLKPNLDPIHIDSWIKEYKEGKLSAFKKSEPIPEQNNEPVKVVVADSLQDIVFNSGKNVLLEFYAPWCGHCKKLAPILDEVAVSFENDDDIIIAKLDATANDYPSDTFDVKGYPTLYFKSASGKLMQYDGDRSKEDMIDFIGNNREKGSRVEAVEKDGQEEEESNAKDEL